VKRIAKEDFLRKKIKKKEKKMEKKIATVRKRKNLNVWEKNAKLVMEIVFMKFKKNSFQKFLVTLSIVKI